MNLNITPEYNFQTLKKKVHFGETGISSILENLSLDARVDLTYTHPVDSGMSDEIKPKIEGINRKIDALETEVSLMTKEGLIKKNVERYHSSTRRLAILRVASENLISSEEVEWDSTSLLKGCNLIKSII